MNRPLPPPDPGTLPAIPVQRAPEQPPGPDRGSAPTPTAPAPTAPAPTAPMPTAPAPAARTRTAPAPTAPAIAPVDGPTVQLLPVAAPPAGSATSVAPTPAPRPGPRPATGPVPETDGAGTHGTGPDGSNSGNTGSGSTASGSTGSGTPASGGSGSGGSGLPGSAGRPGRLLGLDAARGIALFGIIAVHALVESTDDGAPTLNYLIFGGRSAALFALLAGVSLAFMTGRVPVRRGPELRSTAAMLATRAGILLLLALALSWTDPSIATLILPYYAVAFVLAIPLVALPTRVLAPLAVLLCLGVPVLSHLVRPYLPAADPGHPSVVDLVTDPLALLSGLAVTGAYPAVIWLAYMAVGIAVGRLRLTSVRTAATLLGGGLTAALVATGISMLLLGPGGGYAAIAAAGPPELTTFAPTIADAVAYFPDGVTPTTTWWWLATVAPHSGTPLDVVQTTGSALAVLGAVLLLTAVTTRGVSTVLGHVLRPLAAAGAMTLTLYVASVLFMNSPLDTFEPVQGYLVQIAVAAAAGLAWRRAVGRGPLETLVSAPSRTVRDRVRTRTAGRDRVSSPAAGPTPVAGGPDRP